MISDLDAQRLSRLDPGDSALVSTGTVISVDAANHLVQVAIRGDLQAVVWLPAVADRYQPGGSCRVLHNSQDSGRSVQVLGAVDPFAPAVLGLLTAVNTTTYRATVTVLGSSTVVPYMPTGTYTANTRVWVLLDEWGRPSTVVAPSSEATATGTPTAPETGGAATTVQATVTIGPQWSGTYRYTRSAWDRWNTASYGGRSTLYQGNGFGSGALAGLATYGDQIVNLGATSIDRMQVALRSVGLSGASGPATVQGSPHGSQPAGAPTTAGDTASGDGWVDLPATVRETFRTGGFRGLATIGGNYWAVAGAGNGDGMALQITYTRPA